VNTATEAVIVEVQQKQHMIPNSHSAYQFGVEPAAVFVA
jgi:hypothetical protein